MKVKIDPKKKGYCANLVKDALAHLADGDAKPGQEVYMHSIMV